MRKFILLSIMCLFALVANSQPFAHARGHFRSIFTTVDTLVVKNTPSLYPTRDGDYLIEFKNEQKLIIAYNTDHSKAIVLRGYDLGRHMVFNVKYDEARLILWFKDEHIYCGYIYDTKSKGCQYFEAINENEKDKLSKRFPFLRRMPTFTDSDKE